MHRRQFLGTALAAGAGHQVLADLGKARGLSKAELPTPALLLDLDVFEKNLRKMADHCQQAGIQHRPHAKTHKCPEIARRQVSAGAVGVCVATVPEAEAMVRAGIKGVLLTSPIADRGKAARMAALARDGVMLAIGEARSAGLLCDAAELPKGASIDVLIDLDVGDHRTGCLPGRPALDLAWQVARMKLLNIRGVQAYSGRSSHTAGFANRQKASREAMAQAVETFQALRKQGHAVEILSGGSTGTYNIDSQIKGVTELQVGSYIFMDVNYRRIGSQDGNTLYADFQPSLTVLTTVVAVHADRATVDAGVKAFSTDVAEKPEATNWPGIIYNRAGDEFGSLTADGGKLPALGDRLEFLVPHCDPTVNLYDRIYALRGGKVEDVWRIEARRE